ncbi:MAG: hypothetical protein RMJ15_06220 [Nitrososphaerota archaeon]|nr:hypothetical protein [Nitrososphaerota archaeon]
MDKARTRSVFLTPLKVFLVVHHLLFWQRLFDAADIMHHEFFKTILSTTSITVLTPKGFNKARRA